MNDREARFSELDFEEHCAGSAGRAVCDDADVDADARPHLKIVQEWQTKRPLPWGYDNPDEYRRDLENYMKEYIWLN